jgi:3-hydroxy-9,10-secoandrosta-1,3,5(10)-triene-9,17-dione monooxygenase reductase component
MKQEMTAGGSGQAVGNASVDPGRFRAAMGAFATGVAIITTRTAEGCHGMAVNSLTSVSLDPCLLLFCVKHGSKTGAAIRERRTFAVNLLAGDQHHLVKQFCANPEDRFAGVPMALSECGLPVLQGSLAHLCCTIEDVHVSGDHDIVVGRVHALAENGGEPLVFFRGRYGGYHMHPPVEDAGGQRIAV